MRKKKKKKKKGKEKKMSKKKKKSSSFILEMYEAKLFVNEFEQLLTYEVSANRQQYQIFSNKLKFLEVLVHGFKHNQLVLALSGCTTYESIVFSPNRINHKPSHYCFHFQIPNVISNSLQQSCKILQLRTYLWANGNCNLLS